MRGVILLVVAALGLAMCELLIETENEEVWWEAPSRKAPLYAHKYYNLQERLKRAVVRQGEEMRLPRDILPETYTIKLLPFIEEGNFTTHGSIEILVNCKIATSNISLNAAELEIDTDSIQVFEVGTPSRPLKYSEVIDEQSDREMITIPMDAKLEAGKSYKLSMNFVSKLNTDLRGFYRSSYVENNVTKYLAVSQMEAADARRAFPCFDEPNMKAKFTITLGSQTTMPAISNMPVKNIEPIEEMPGYQWTFFEESVEMSSYLVAMMVSDFVSASSDPELSPGVSFNIWSRPSFIDQAEYSSVIGPKILRHYAEDYFNISFPLPKVDMAAIPDFAAGAMENWGLITYREADLLYDPNGSSAAAKQRVAVIIAHELAHQWFGNLVTMDWWNVLWLNEGFASYMEYVGTNFVEENFEMNEQFTVTDLHYVFGIDALESSRPIDFEVNTPAQINQMFDAISYEKGSCIIRMCADFLSEPTFRRGITRYLENNAYGNTEPEDLWSALQEQADEDDIRLPASVETIMSTWTKQMGYPFINVTRNYNDANTASVTQERFLLRKNDNSSDVNEYRWYIPLTYTSTFINPTIGRVWYPSEEKGAINVTLGGSDKNQWVLFNVGQEGYYRVLYDETNLHMIQNQLMNNHSLISKKNRAQIIDDYLNFARAGIVPYDIAMDLTLYLEYEKDYAPWTAASVALEYIDIMFYGLEDEKDWKTYMTGPITHLYQHVGYNEANSDTQLKIFTRSQAISWACGKLNIAGCIESAKDDYEAWMNDDSPLPPNLRRIVACTAIANGDRQEWEFGFENYVNSTLPNEKTDLLRAITCTQDVDILNELLDAMITEGSGIRLQDANTLFSNVAANPVGHQVALDFLDTRWDDIYEYFGNYQGFGGGSIASLFRALCNRVNTEQKLAQLMEVMNNHTDVLGNSKTAIQGLELAEANVKWVESHYDTIVSWLQNRITETTQKSTQKTTTSNPTTPSWASSYHSSIFITISFVVVLHVLRHFVI